MRSRARATLIVTLVLGVTWGASSLAEVNPTRLPRSYLLPFWIGQALEGLTVEQMRRRDPRIRESDGHPCGAIVMARVGRLPSARDAILGTEAIREVVTSGRVARTWSVPGDAIPVGIDGPRILAIVHQQGYWFGQDRSITPWAGDVPKEQPGAQCPGPIAGFGGNDYGCTTLKDRSSGRLRTLAWYFVCT